MSALLHAQEPRRGTEEQRGQKAERKGTSSSPFGRGISLTGFFCVEMGGSWERISAEMSFHSVGLNRVSSTGGTIVFLLSWETGASSEYERREEEARGVEVGATKKKDGRVRRVACDGVPRARIRGKRDMGR